MLDSEWSKNSLRFFMVPFNWEWILLERERDRWWRWWLLSWTTIYEKMLPKELQFDWPLELQFDWPLLIIIIIFVLFLSQSRMTGFSLWFSPIIIFFMKHNKNTFVQKNITKKREAAIFHDLKLLRHISNFSSFSQRFLSFPCPYEVLRAIESPTFYCYSNFIRQRTKPILVR